MESPLQNAGPGITDAYAPPYHYDPTHGYQDPEQQSNNTQARDQQHVLNSEEASEDDSLLLSSDEISESELGEANPNDYTKSYNRQRRQLDPSIPADQKPKANPQKPKANTSTRIDDQIASLSRHADKLRLYERADSNGGNEKGDKDRADRATNDQVLDPRTRMVLLQMINRGVVSEINGCVSTGKEANVYHAIADADGQPYPVAIKVFKTSILVFKARSEYTGGEHRFTKTSKPRNNRQMVIGWTEKEFRNLSRLYAAGLPVPEPLFLRANVIAMRFVGSRKGWSAPLLRDVTFTDDDPDTQWAALYRQVLRLMRTMYTTCHLVHADLSEYNMLYHAGKLWLIDVSQSVEHAHPRSLDFLRMDVKNITRFFAAKGAPVLPEAGVFRFIVAEKAALDDAGMDSALDALARVAVTDDGADADADKLAADNAVFRSQYIPQRLDEVADPEHDIEMLRTGERSGLVYESLLAEEKSARSVDGDEESEDGASDESDAERDDDVDGDGHEKRPRGKRFEDKAAKKAHKVAVKEEKREKRATKIPKKEKRRLVNKGTHK